MHKTLFSFTKTKTQVVSVLNKLEIVLIDMQVYLQCKLNLKVILRTFKFINNKFMFVHNCIIALKSLILQHTTNEGIQIYLFSIF